MKKIPKNGLSDTLLPNHVSFLSSWAKKMSQQPGSPENSELTATNRIKIDLQLWTIVLPKPPKNIQIGVLWLIMSYEEYRQCLLAIFVRQN